jgi:hypothetical protein
MPEFYDSGGSDPITGAARSLADITVPELLRLPPSPARPDWMITRYPVPIEEYERLRGEAEAPAPAAAAAAEEVVADPTTAGEDVLAVASVLDPPEGGVAAPAPAAPPVVASFAGIHQTAWRPPDPTLAAGPSDVLVGVNADLAGYTKAGVLRFRWPNFTALFNPVMPAGASPFDPRVAFDHYDKRWIVVVGARRANPPGSWLLVGISQGQDPAGAYWIWALDATLDGSRPTGNWADYPMLGFDTQGIYICSNMFAFSGGFQYAKLRILQKAEVYNGGIGPSHTIRWYDFWNLRNPDNSMAFTVQPAVHFRGAGANPPAYLVNALWPGGSTLTLWTLTNPVAFWTGGAPSLARVAIRCRQYELPPGAQRPGTSVPIATNDARLLNAVYQNAEGSQRLWTCQTSKHTWPGEPAARSEFQWYEIDVPTSAVSQQNRFGAPGKYYFFPAVQTDRGRNAFLVFGRCGADEFAQLRQTGRQVGDAPNTLQGSVLLKPGASSYTGGRWGDYFGICRDGGDSRTVWMYGEFADTGNTWGTWVAAARYL